jgi:hypothetical protein
MESDTRFLVFFLLVTQLVYVVCMWATHPRDSKGRIKVTSDTFRNSSIGQSCNFPESSSRRRACSAAVRGGCPAGVTPAAPRPTTPFGTAALPNAVTYDKNL